jgi:hypothetical protein
MVKTSSGQISENEARNLLNKLCVKYGFCLSALWNARLQKNPPNTVEKYAETVFKAEGLDPKMADSDLYKKIREEVYQAFQRSLSESTS